MAVSADPLLEEHAALLAQLGAWTDAWKHRREHGSAAMVTMMSAMHLGDPLAQRLEKRMLLAKAHLEVRIATMGAAFAGAIAKLGGDADASGIANAVRDAIVRVGHADEDFGSKLAELGPIVETYRRLRMAIDPPR